MYDDKVRAGMARTKNFSRDFPGSELMFRMVQLDSGSSEESGLPL